MTISATITTELADLQAQLAAATPLTQAGHASVVAIKLNAGQLLNDVQSALIAPANLLDTWTAPSDAPAMASGLLGVLDAAEDQSALALARGQIGRVVSNLNQVPS